MNKHKNAQKNNKIFESLPRQSTVDQLKRIRKEIKKSQIVKVGPEKNIIQGDIGDKVSQDIKKHNLLNLFWYDNPIDRDIDSYESFIKKDSKKSLGYTKKGDSKKNEQSKYLKEGINPDDPMDEDYWPDPNDEKTIYIISQLKILYENYNKFDKYLTREELNKHVNDFINRLLISPIEDEKIYEIRDYWEGGFNDPGIRKGFIKGRNKNECRALYAILKGDIDIVYQGLRFSLITQKEIDEEIRQLQKKLNMLTNIPSFDTIKNKK